MSDEEDFVKQQDLLYQMIFRMEKVYPNLASLCYTMYRRGHVFNHEVIDAILEVVKSEMTSSQDGGETLFQEIKDIYEEIQSRITP